MSTRSNFKGVLTAIITPMKNGQVDYPSLTKLIKAQLAGRVDGFVVNGTTGESPTLKEEEIKEIFQFVRKQAPQAAIILGAGSNSTEKALHLTQIAENLGADAALSVVPYYNKPPQRGLIQHFQYIAERTSIPLILYNVPGRTVASMDVSTIVELSQHENIVGIKEASGNISFAKELRQKCPANFALLSGDDGTYVDFLEIGGDGVISVASHVIPEVFHEWTEWAKTSQFVKAKESIAKYKALIDMLFCEANPIPVKKAVQFMGLIEKAELRLPLVELSPDWSEKLKIEMQKVGVLK